MDDPRTIFARNLELTMKKQWTKVKEVAEYAQVSEQTVYRWLKGKSLPAPEQFQRLSERLFWPYSEMFRTDGPTANALPPSTEYKLLSRLSTQEQSILNLITSNYSAAARIIINMRNLADQWPEVKATLAQTGFDIEDV